MVSGWLPLLLLIAYGGLCLGALFVSQRLLSRFREKRPELAAKYLPESADRLAHPKKLFFFLKPSAGKMLADDLELLRLRKRFIWLLWCVPLYWFVAALFIVLALALKFW